MSDEQKIELTRVKARISKHVLTFVTKCNMKSIPEFQMRELQEYVFKKMGHYVAPDSPSRILRQLRLDGALNYTVVNRRKSLYRIEEVSEVKNETLPTL
jgi:hypothetical protein